MSLAIVGGTVAPDQLNEDPQECGPHIELPLSSFQPHRAVAESRGDALCLGLRWGFPRARHRRAGGGRNTGEGLAAPARDTQAAPARGPRSRRRLVSARDAAPAPAEGATRGAGWESGRPWFHGPLTRPLRPLQLGNAACVNGGLHGGRDRLGAHQGRCSAQFPLVLSLGGRCASSFSVVRPVRLRDVRQGPGLHPYARGNRPVAKKDKSLSFHS